MTQRIFSPLQGGPVTEVSDRHRRKLDFFEILARGFDIFRHHGQDFFFVFTQFVLAVNLRGGQENVKAFFSRFFQRPSARIDGWYWQHDGAGLCNGELRDGLNEGVPAGIPALQSLLSLGLGVAAGERRFSTMYLLPGQGGRSGFSEDDADRRIALAMIPI